MTHYNTERGGRDKPCSPVLYFFIKIAERWESPWTSMMVPNPLSLALLALLYNTKQKDITSDLALWFKYYHTRCIKTVLATLSTSFLIKTFLWVGFSFLFACQKCFMDLWTICLPVCIYSKATVQALGHLSATSSTGSQWRMSAGSGTSGGVHEEV